MTLNSPIIQLIKNGRFVFYTNAVEKISFLIFFVLAARTSSLDEYGNLIAVFTLANIFSFFLEFGFSAYLQRESSFNNASLMNDYSVIFFTKIFFYFPYIFLCQLYFYFSTDSSLWLVFVICSLVYLFSLNTTLNGILFGKKLFRQSFLAHLFGRIIFLALSFFSLFLIRDYILLIIFFFIGAVFHLITICRYFHNISFRISLNKLQFSTMKKILSSSLPIGMGTFFAFAYDKIDVLLIRGIINSNAVAIYSAGYSLYKLSQIITPIILVPFFTELSSKYKSNSFGESTAMPVVSKMIKKNGALLLIYSAVAATILFFFSKYFIWIIYGEKFAASTEVTRMLVFALPGLFLNNLTGVALNSIGKEKYQFFATTLGLIINIAANLFLISQIGIYGAVYSTVITETFVFLLQAYFLTVFLKGNKIGCT